MAKVVAEETESSDEKRRLVAAILQLGGTPGFETVAKGIDSESQRNRLRALGFRHGQWYPYTHPIPAHELHSALERAHVA